MTPRPVDTSGVVSAVRDLSGSNVVRTVFVGIDGFGASGKTTLAAAVAGAVDSVTVVHVDDFWGPNITEWDWVRFRAQLVRPLLDGRPGRYQLWDWAADTGGEWRTVPPGRIVVVEGVSSTRRETGVDWSLTVWVDAPVGVRRARAIARDGEDVWTSRWERDWIPLEQAYAAREHPRDRCDLVVGELA